MKEKYLRIFFYDLSLIYGKVELTEDFPHIFTSFIKSNLGIQTVNLFNKIIDIEITKDGNASVSFTLGSIKKACEDVFNDKVNGIFDDIDINTSNDIGILASMFSSYIEEIDELMSDTSFQQTLLLQ